MSKSIVVELAEQGIDTQNIASGDYVVNLKEPILVEKNDQISLKSVFVDSVDASDGKIIVLPDVEKGTKTTISATFGYYILDWGSTFEADKVSKLYSSFDGAAAFSTPSGNAYILNQPLVVDSGDDALFLTGFTHFIDLSDSRIHNDAKNNLHVQFNITQNPDGSGKVITKPMRISIGYIPLLYGKILKYLTPVPDSKGRTIYSIVLNNEVLEGLTKDGFNVVKSGLTFPCSINSQVLVDSAANIKITSKGNTGFMDNKATEDAVIDIQGTTPYDNKLYTSTVSFQIDSGSYEPSDLTALLSGKFTEEDLGSAASAAPASQIVTNNPLLKTSKQIMGDPLFSAFVPVGGEATYQPTWFSMAKNGTLHYNSATDANLNYVFGSSQFGLTYDAEFDKVEFSQIHSSLYSSDSSNTATGTQIRFISNATDDKVKIDRHSGIFFTDLQPQSLWYDMPNSQSQFRFDRSIITTIDTDKTNIGTVGTVYQIPHELKVGVNCTADESSIDTVIVKAASAYDPAIITNNQSFDIAADFPLTTIVVGTSQITAKNSLTTNTNKGANNSGGYFKIEVDMPNILQDVRTSTGYNKKIQSVISRFYNSQSYTSAYNEGSIPIVYNFDNPAYVDTFRVRILEPNGNVSTTIGNTSAIFIQIDKAETIIK